MTCIGSHDVTSGELNSAPFTNSASASGTYGSTGVNSNTASADVDKTPDQIPQMTLVETVAEIRGAGGTA